VARGRTRVQLSESQGGPLELNSEQSELELELLMSPIYLQS
jgi:hypothetical protein